MIGNQTNAEKEAVIEANADHERINLALEIFGMPFPISCRV